MRYDSPFQAPPLSRPYPAITPVPVLAACADASMVPSPVRTRMKISLPGVASLTKVSGATSTRRWVWSPW